jgi:hypothetical protein
MYITRNILLVCLLFFSFIAAGQKFHSGITREQAYFYPSLTGNYLDMHDSGYLKKSEMAIMFLKLDTAGRVVSINIMADDQKDSTLYWLLKRITPDFYNSKGSLPAASEKSIIFPVYCLSYFKDPNNYIDRLSEPPTSPLFTEDQTAIIAESYNYIQVNGTNHVVRLPEMPKRSTPAQIEEGNKFISENNKTDEQKIYAAIITRYYDYKPAAIVVIDSTLNRNLISSDLAEVALEIYTHDSIMHYSRLNSTWKEWLALAFKKKVDLTENKLPRFKPYQVSINFVKIDSIRRVGHDFSEIFKVRDQVSVSRIIRMDDKAIVVMDRSCGALCGEGMLYFLEKKNGRWIVIMGSSLWVS